MLNSIHNEIMMWRLHMKECRKGDKKMNKREITRKIEEIWNELIEVKQ